MLKITVPASPEKYDELNNCFIPATKEQTLSLEHSLVSVSKWEAKWHRAYVNDGPKTTEELADYIRCMTLTQNVDPNIYTALSTMPQLLRKASAYINESMTATRFPKNSKPPNGETITSEIIYYWMVSYNIPFECQKWHLNRLLTLIHVCNMKNGPQRKMSKREIIEQNRSLNAARRKRLNTRG